MGGILVFDITDPKAPKQIGLSEHSRELDGQLTASPRWQALHSAIDLGPEGCTSFPQPSRPTASPC
jgi:hypothetical protein